MKDIGIAKNMLTKENLTLVIVKNGEIIYKSNQKGISPLFRAVNEVKESLKGSSVADKVIGKAAAMLKLDSSAISTKCVRRLYLILSKR